MGTRHLSGQVLKKMILAGARRVINKKDHLNKINVFPVPDGDTGSNMASAFHSISKEVTQDMPEEIKAVGDRVADAAINGARGNSGTILAQFFNSFCEHLSKHEQPNVEHFAKAAYEGSEAARQAVSQPKEGTMITVMQDWGQFIKAHWQEMPSLEELMRKSLVIAQDSLARTPEKLEVLRQNHVVDAGAQGFVNFLEGATDYLLEGKLEENEHARAEEINDAEEQQEVQVSDSEIQLTYHQHDADALTHQFCTECIVSAQTLNIPKIRRELSEFGNSMVVVGGQRKAKIHIHTNAPQQVFRLLSEHGEILETKAEDMWAQFRVKEGLHAFRHIALLVDSACNLPLNLKVKYNLIVFPLQVMINDRAYLEGVTLDQPYFLSQLKNPEAHLGSSQANSQDMRAALERALRTSPRVLAILLSSGVSGTFDAFSQLAKRYDGEEISLIDSKTGAHAAGLIVYKVAQAIQAGKRLEEVQALAEQYVKNSKIYFYPTSLDRLIRGGRLKGARSWIARIFHLLPILGTNETGVLGKIAMGFTSRFTRKKMLKLALNYAKQFQRANIWVGHVDMPEAAQELAKQVQKYSACPVEIVEVSPVIAVHTGQALGLTVLGER